MPCQKMIVEHIHHNSGEAPAVRADEPAAGDVQRVPVGKTIDRAMQRDGGTYAFVPAFDHPAFYEVAQHRAYDGVGRFMRQKYVGQIIHVTTELHATRGPVGPRFY